MRQIITVDGMARGAADRRSVDGRWPVRRTAAFVAALSVSLWAGIIGLVVVAL